MNFFGNYVLIATDGRRWCTSATLIPENIEGVPLKSFAMADQTAFFIDENGQLYTNKREDTLDLNWNIKFEAESHDQK